jgi:hypothetical protein
VTIDLETATLILYGLIAATMVLYVTLIVLILKKTRRPGTCPIGRRSATPRRKKGDSLNSGSDCAFTSVANASHRSLNAAPALRKHPTTAVRNPATLLPSIGDPPYWFETWNWFETWRIPSRAARSSVGRSTPFYLVCLNFSQLAPLTLLE